jgi:PAS domain S-box-containing protein
MDRTANLQSIFPGGSEMARLMREFDWSTSEVGVPEKWPESLKAAVRICVSSRNPIVIWWGKTALTQIYNDGYMRILTAAKHPQWLGRSGAACWSEIMETMGPMWEQVLATGEATWSEDFLYIMNRNLHREECYFTFSYSALQNDSGIVDGILCICYETTSRVISDGRLRTLRDLGRTVATAKTPEAACETTADILAANPGDIPFSLLYLLDDDAKQARLVATSGFACEHEAGPDKINLTSSVNGVGWPLSRVLHSGSTELVSDLPNRFGQLPGGLWPESPETALIVSIISGGQSRGFLVAGFSPRRIVDADYRSFFDLIAGHVSTAIANATAYEEERKRAEALLALDRAKTEFFSNVSHEFRTPLTLMLGNLEEVLCKNGNMQENRPRLEIAHRNSLRLLKLVNTLLDFSRIEAGRQNIDIEAVDLCSLTRDLASTFRSAIENAGLKYIVDCDQTIGSVPVDREMWEKIVLNLLSNAFKFTFNGEIEVKLQIADQQSVFLAVRDTGVGIPPSEVDKIFDRFHRVASTQGRTHEGTGIGLALVKDLVQMHGGLISVESTLGEGSVFTVTIPKGEIGDAQPKTKSWQNKSSVAAYLNDIAHVDESPVPAHPDAGQRGVGTILLADDNADMREYVTGLLVKSGYAVTAVRDGREGFEAAVRERPDLVLTDVMMPRLDGFGLLSELRADERTKDIPIVMLSARAGEEARIEGLREGADDYLIKPFSARELLARIRSMLELSRVRHENQRVLLDREERLTAANADLQRVVAELHEANEKRREAHRAALNVLEDAIEAKEQLRESEEKYRTLFDSMNEGCCITQMIYDDAGKAVDWRFLQVNRAFELNNGLSNAEGKTIRELMPNVESKWMEIYDRVAQTGEPVRMEEKSAALERIFDLYAFRVGEPHKRKVAVILTDITVRKRSERILRESDARLRGLLAGTAQAFWEADRNGVVVSDSPSWRAHTGQTLEEMMGYGWVNAIHPDDRKYAERQWRAAVSARRRVDVEFRLRAPDGSYRWTNVRAVPLLDDAGAVEKWLGMNIDIEDRKCAEIVLRKSSHQHASGTPIP